MSYKRILTVQDISCLGQCSITVALPVLSACGHETCIIPSAVLSTHTGEFKGYTFRDLTDDVPDICRHWKSEGISFDAVYTGYLGSARQAAYVKDIFSSLLRPGGKIIVDPAMADNGRLYAGFDAEYVEAMRGLCTRADVILPNITEACLLTGVPYREQYDGSYTDALLRALASLGTKCVVLTGVSYEPENTGVLVYDGAEKTYYKHPRIPRMFHGTGDVYASAFAGSWLRGMSLSRAAEIAADFTVAAIEKTRDDSVHWYGVKFELALPSLIRAIEL